jgi:hypothetical protein
VTRIENASRYPKPESFASRYIFKLYYNVIIVTNHFNRLNLIVTIFFKLILCPFFFSLDRLNQNIIFLVKLFQCYIIKADSNIGKLKERPVDAVWSSPDSLTSWLSIGLQVVFFILLLINSKLEWKKYRETIAEEIQNVTIFYENLKRILLKISEKNFQRQNNLFCFNFTYKLHQN